MVGRSSNGWKNGKSPSFRHPRVWSPAFTRFSASLSEDRVNAGLQTEGAALIVALWVLMILSLLISTFAFEMHIEAGITSYHRKKLKAQYLAQAGVEYAKMLLIRSAEAKEDDEATAEANENLVENSIRLSRGVSVSGMEIELGKGKIVLSIAPEEGRRNVNVLVDEDWEEILDQANIPKDLWDELIDCYTDWVDENDFSQLNGAESDDSFYDDAGYECKNAPIDTVDELRLIKGFTHEIVYGGKMEDDDDEPLLGIAKWLTTWGDGKININTASREVLLTLSGMDEMAVDEILDGRTGEDGELGTRDDGWESVDEVIGATGLPEDLKDKITVRDKQFLRVVSRGVVGNIETVVWCVLQQDGTDVKPVFWREETD